MKAAPLIIGIAALGGLGYYMSTQSTTGGSLSGGGTTSNTTVQPGGITDSSGDSSGETETIEKSWKKRGSVSKSYNRSTCDLNGWKAQVYTESTKYPPESKVAIAVLAKYYETSGDNDWWGYCGGGNVPKSWYGNDEKIYTGITVTSDEDPSSVITVQNYGTYPQSPDYTGGDSIVPSGGLTQSILDDCTCRGEDASAKGDWGLAVYSFTAPSTPGRYTIEFKMGLSNPTGPCSAQSNSAKFSILVGEDFVLSSETFSAPTMLSGNRFTPVASIQSHRVW